MSTSIQSPASPTSADPEIISTRVIAAPRDLIWSAWTEPLHLAQWWGPQGFTNTFREFDLRPGGHWRFTMHGPDGRAYDNHSVFVEIAAPGRIVFDHVSEPKFRVTATLAEQPGGTKITFVMRFESAAVCESVRPLCTGANQENFDRLEVELAKMRPAAAPGAADRELVLTRIIDAPRERIFKAWTTQLPEWWGPHGMTTPFCELDLRPGGVFRTVMRTPDGTEYPTKGVFLEVVENERIVFTDAFGPGWVPDPDAFFTAITTFEALWDGKTRYTARALHWTAANREKHEKMGFHHGWGESLDRLVALVTKR